MTAIGLLLGAFILARCVAGATELDGEVSGVGRFAYMVCFLASAFLVSGIF